MTESSPGFLERLARWGTAAENAALVLLLTAMMVLATGQIFLRIFFSIGFVWADELIKLMVFWIAMIASIAAARSNRHLRIDVVSHFVPAQLARVPKIVVDAFASFMCGVLTWQSWRYVRLTLEFEETVLVDVPAWVAYGVLPLAFALMCYRFLLSSVAETIAAIRRLPAEADTP